MYDVIGDVKLRYDVDFEYNKLCLHLHYLKISCEIEISQSTNSLNNTGVNSKIIISIIR